MIDRQELTALLERPGPWTYAYVDGPGPEPQVIEERRRDSVQRRLIDSGAPEEDAAVVAAALERKTGLPAPSARYLLADAGEVVLDESIPGPRIGPEAVGHSPVPPLLPLLRDRGSGIRYLVVEAGRGDAEVRLERAGREPEWAAEIEGRTDALPKVQAGGWSQSRYQRTSEEIWKHNQDELAAVVDRLVQQHSPTFVVVSGDVRARQLLKDQFGAAARALVVDVEAHTHAAGADQAPLDAAIQAALEEHLRTAEQRIMEDAAVGSGSTGAHGTEEVVEALRQARVERLLLDARMLESDRRLVALDDSPWVAVEDVDALTAGIVDRIPAAEALARAALLTGAEVVVEEEHTAEGEAREERPPREPIAVLRWAEADAQ